VTTPVADGPAVAALGPEVAAARAAGSPAWLAARRRIAWDAFEALPMPSSARDEDWRRTDISGLRLERFVPIDSVDPALIADMRRHHDTAAPQAAFAIDAPGIDPIIENADTLLAQGVIVTTLEEAAGRHADLTKRALGAMTVDESKFIALWNAMWRGGVFVHVPAGVEAQVPVWIAHAAGSADAAVFPSTVIVLEEGASLTVIDDYASPDGSGELLSDTIAVLNIGRDSRLDYVALQRWNSETWHMATHRATLGPNAKLRFFGFTLGAKLQKAYWEALLEGTGAEAEIRGVCLGGEAQHLDHQSLQSHRAPETVSDLLLKVAVRDKARSVYSGLIYVAPEAVHANGYVKNQNLMLSRQAKADSVPRLEIRANDVRCGHGATAGHIDDDERFYLMARGVPPEQADALIVRGFMDDVVGRVPYPPLASWLGRLLDEEISGESQFGLNLAGEDLEAAV
jgi:Fe-S cluster assembly protein SufD